MQTPEARTRVTEYTVSCLPPGHKSEPNFSLTVAERSPGRWAVTRYGFCYSTDGERSYESITGESEDDFIRRHWFSLREALELARRIAPTITVNGHTVMDVLTDE